MLRQQMYVNFNSSFTREFRNELQMKKELNLFLHPQISSCTTLWKFSVQLNCYYFPFTLARISYLTSDSFCLNIIIFFAYLFFCMLQFLLMSLWRNLAILSIRHAFHLNMWHRTGRHITNTSADQWHVRLKSYTYSWRTFWTQVVISVDKWTCG